MDLAPAVGYETAVGEGQPMDGWTPDAGYEGDGWTPGAGDGGDGWTPAAGRAPGAVCDRGRKARRRSSRSRL